MAQAHPNQLVALKLGAEASARRRAADKQAGLAYAREWRLRNAPIFDELYR